MKTGMWLAVAVALFAATVQAGEGRPSQSKLSKLGLSSMQVVDDHAGSQVRGEGAGILGARFFGIANTSGYDAPGGFIAGPYKNAPAFGSLGTINGGVNTPFTLQVVQSSNGSNFLIGLSNWGSVSGAAN